VTKKIFTVKIKMAAENIHNVTLAGVRPDTLPFIPRDVPMKELSTEESNNIFTFLACCKRAPKGKKIPVRQKESEKEAEKAVEVSKQQGSYLCNVWCRLDVLLPFLLVLGSLFFIYPRLHEITKNGPSDTANELYKTVNDASIAVCQPIYNRYTAIKNPTRSEWNDYLKKDAECKEYNEIVNNKSIVDRLNWVAEYKSYFQAWWILGPILLFGFWRLCVYSGRHFSQPNAKEFTQMQIKQTEHLSNQQNLEKRLQLDQKKFDDERQHRNAMLQLEQQKADNERQHRNAMLQLEQQKADNQNGIHPQIVPNANSRALPLTAQQPQYQEVQQPLQIRQEVQQPPVNSARKRTIEQTYDYAVEEHCKLTDTQKWEMKEITETEEAKSIKDQLGKFFGLEEKYKKTACTVFHDLYKRRLLYYQEFPNRNLIPEKYAVLYISGSGQLNIQAGPNCTKNGQKQFLNNQTIDKTFNINNRRDVDALLSKSPRSIDSRLLTSNFKFCRKDVNNSKVQAVP
jgi:hypothetical protein